MRPMPCLVDLGHLRGEKQLGSPPEQPIAVQLLCFSIRNYQSKGASSLQGPTRTRQGETNQEWQMLFPPSPRNPFCAAPNRAFRSGSIPQVPDMLCTREVEKPQRNRVGRDAACKRRCYHSGSALLPPAVFLCVSTKMR